MADQFKLSDPAFETKRKLIYNDAVKNATRYKISAITMTDWGVYNTSWVDSWAIVENKSSATPVDHLNKNEAKAKLT